MYLLKKDNNNESTIITLNDILYDYYTLVHK